MLEEFLSLHRPMEAAEGHHQAGIGKEEIQTTRTPTPAEEVAPYAAPQREMPAKKTPLPTYLVDESDDTWFPNARGALTLLTSNPVSFLHLVSNPNVSFEGGLWKKKTCPYTWGKIFNSRIMYSTPKEALILLNTHHDDGSTSGEKLAAGVIMRHGQIWQRAIEDHRWFLLDLLYLHTTAPTVAA
jgi:hypothetical protein